MEPIIFAHRGASGHERENTVEAFELAVKLGATGIETDAWITADGVIVLDHDGVVGSSLRRKRKISQLTRAELPPHIPTFSELLEMPALPKHISIDVCDPNVFERLQFDLVPSDTTLWLCSGDLELLSAWREHNSEVKLVHSTWRKHLKAGMERHAATLRERGVDALNLHHTEWTGGNVALLHRFKRLCWAWDTQHVRNIEAMVAISIDAVFGDYVDRLTEVVTTR